MLEVWPKHLPMSGCSYSSASTLLFYFFFKYMEIESLIQYGLSFPWCIRFLTLKTRLEMQILTYCVSGMRRRCRMSKLSPWRWQIMPQELQCSTGTKREAKKSRSPTCGPAAQLCNRARGQTRQRQRGQVEGEESGLKSD